LIPACCGRRCRGRGTDARIGRIVGVVLVNVLVANRGPGGADRRQRKPGQ
jgi:hypothetical protein